VRRPAHEVSFHVCPNYRHDPFASVERFHTTADDQLWVKEIL